jgi:hypothetical protein
MFQYLFMRQFTDHPTFYDRPILLNPEQREAPVEVMKDFFDGFCLSEIRQMLWKMIHTAVSTENYFFQEYHQRDALLLFYEKLEQFLEAGFVLTAGEGASVCHAHSA